MKDLEQENSRLVEDQINQINQEEVIIKSNTIINPQ